METWHIDHPEMGRIELILDSPERLRELDSGWPMSKQDVEGVEEAGGSVDEHVKKEADWADTAAFGLTATNGFFGKTVPMEGRLPVVGDRTAKLEAGAARIRKAGEKGVLITELLKLCRKKSMTRDTITIARNKSNITALADSSV